MFDDLLKGLASQGPMGLMVGLLVLVFVRFFNRTFDAQVERDRANTQFMQNCLAVLQEIKTACTACRSDIITSEITRIGSTEDRIIAEVRAAGDRIIAETRRDNDLSRPHQVTPPPMPMETIRQPYPPVVGRIR
jgi:hypothetical protein